MSQAQTARPKLAPPLVLWLLAGLASSGSAPRPAQGQSPAAADSTPTTAAAASAVDSAPEIEVDDALPSYTPGAPVTGAFRAAGAPTTGTVLEVIHVGFSQFHPDVKIEIALGGAATGPPALISGAAQIAHMSRRFTDAEFSAFRSKYGYLPTEIPVAIDGVAIFVHRDNPIHSLTIEQLRDIFSQRRRADGSRVDHWVEVTPAAAQPARAATPPTTSRPASSTPARQPPTGPIALFGIPADRGESVMFREVILGDEPFSAALRVQLTQSSAVQGVAADPSGIGYAASLYACRGVRAVPIVSPTDHRPHACTPADCRSGRYPLATSLYLYLNKPPAKPLPRPLEEFLRFALSYDGQRLVAAAGAFPLSADAANEAFQKIAR